MDVFGLIDPAELAGGGEVGGDEGSTTVGSPDEVESGEEDASEDRHVRRKERRADSGVVKMALSLYKVQLGIYLLDFQRVEVNKILVPHVILFNLSYSSGRLLWIYEIEYPHHCRAEDFVRCIQGSGGICGILCLCVGSGNRFT